MTRQQIRDITKLSLLANIQLYTTPRLAIQDNKIALPKPILGNVVNGIALVFDTYESIVFKEVTCTVEDEYTITFDPGDNLNDKYAIVTYLTY